MKKKTLLAFAIFPLVLTACTNQKNAVEIATEEENTSWEHSTPKTVNTPSPVNTASEPAGWVPIGEEPSTITSTGPSAAPLPAENFAPLEVKMPVNHRIVKDDIYTESFEANPEVVRYDRYLLVDSKPEDGQKYLLSQMVTVNMKGFGLSVEQGMWNTLSGTGYSLCGPLNQSVVSLFGLQLPKVHYKFGPVRLRDAMQMLAGEAYELTVNDALRQICYTPRASSVPEKTTPKTLVYADSEA